MKLSIFTTYSPNRQDLFYEALKCYLDLADEVVIVHGDKTEEAWKPEGYEDMKVKNIWYQWPEEYTFDFIGQQFQRGYDACTGDWVIRMDLDYFFRDTDLKLIIQKLEQNNNSPAMSFWKYQYILPDRFNIKSRTVSAYNKGKFGDKIKLDGGGDLCQPTLGGKLLTSDNVPEMGVPLFNYDCTFNDAKTIEREVGRMNRAYHRTFGSWIYGEDGKQMEGFIAMLRGRLDKPQSFNGIDFHPKYVRDNIKNLSKDKLGYDVFGNFQVCSYYDN